MRMPFELGPLRSAPSARMRPRSGRTTHATMRINGVLPLPDGPTRTTIAPSPTVKLTPSTTPREPSFVGKALPTSVTSILVRIAPAYRLEALEKPHDAVEQQSDEPD